MRKIFIIAVLSPIIISHAANAEVVEDQVSHPGDAQCLSLQTTYKNTSETEAVIESDVTAANILQVVVKGKNNAERKESNDKHFVEYDGDTKVSDRIVDPQICSENNNDLEFQVDDDAMAEAPEDENCQDSDERCEFWAQQGECEINPGYMLIGCKKSCSTCGTNKNPSENQHAAKIKGEGLGSKYGEPQDDGGTRRNEVLRRIEKMTKYMEEEVIKPGYDKVRNQCLNREPLCAFWAVNGECEKNSYMTLHCAPVCESCHMLDISTRCPRDPNAADAMGPGDLHKMFERIVKEEKNVTVHSRPEYATGDNAENANYIIGPWVITIDNFISDEECDRLIELGGQLGYERSTDVGAENFDGTFDAVKSKTRTSENAWCTGECYKDPLAKSAMASIVRLTGVPDLNSEHLQLLKYEKGQFYRRHHDYIEETWDRAPGPRILTAFLYLNDVEAGGGTNFPDLNLTVMPKKGKFLLWPSVMDENPNWKEHRTEHQALDVEAGVKFAANAWIHLRDFKTPNDTGCS